jgi:hypothetical protein
VTGLPSEPRLGLKRQPDEKSAGNQALLPASLKPSGRIGSAHETDFAFLFVGSSALRVCENVILACFRQSRPSGISIAR